MRLLIVEDSLQLALAIQAAFAGKHIRCDIAHTAEDAAILIETTGYALVILDLGLPDIDGLQLLRQLRAARRREPILVLTARGAVQDRIDGLGAGADDYLVKPFHFDELHARVQAVLRRDIGFRDNMLSVDRLSLDTETRQVTIDGKPIGLSTREVELLELLMRRVDHVVPKRLLEDQLFGSGDSLGSNAIEVYIHRVRRRLETHALPLTVQTVRGVGYMLLRS